MAKKSCCKRTVYRYEPSEISGLNYRWWSAEAGPHLDPLKWTGPADFNGFPLPTAAAPDFIGVNNSTNINDNNSGAGAARYGIIHGWVFVPDGSNFLRDNNNSTGELGMVLLGSCCDSLTEQPGGNHIVSTNGADRYLMDPVSVNGGQWYFIYNPQSDNGAFQGLDLEHSADGVEWSEITIQQPEAPEVECMEISACDEIPEDWSLKQPKECCTPTYTQSGGLDESAIIGLIETQRTICEGPFQISSNRTGWWAGWTAITQDANIPLTISDWYPVGNATTSPSCVTDLTFDVDFGNHYFLARRNRYYFWIDYQLLINGAAVQTRTYEIYHYKDEQTITSDINYPLQYELQNIGDTEDGRLNIPAGASVQVEARTRYQVVGAQTGSYFRYIGGLRSNTAYHFSPRNIIIDVT